MRLTAHDVRDALLGVLPTAVGLLLASWVLPGLHLTAWAAVVAAVVVSIVDALVRPLLRVIVGRLGAVVALLLGLAVQLVVLQAALAVAPGAHWDTVGTAAATLVLVAVFGAVGRWLLGAADRDYLVGCHGGLGGWQNRAVLLHPTDWAVDGDLLDRSVPGEAVLYGADAVHRQLVRWLERSDARRPVGGPVPAAARPAARTPATS